VLDVGIERMGALIAGGGPMRGEQARLQSGLGLAYLIRQAISGESASRSPA
jgi:hypothetical protein